MIFYTGKRHVVFDEHNHIEDGKTLFTYDEIISKVDKDRLLDRDEWQYILGHYKIKFHDGGLWIEDEIFLPAAGFRHCGGSVDCVGSYGIYWSSTSYGSESAWRLGFDSGGVNVNWYNRCYGNSVRLVTTVN